MKLTNTTEYNGRDLRGLLLSCARFYEVTLGVGRVTIKRALKQPSTAHGSHRDFVIEMCSPTRFLKSLSAVERLAAVEEGGWADVPAGAFLHLVSVVDWVVSHSDEWYKTTPTWAEGYRLRFKVPKPKVRPTGAAYHRLEMTKLEKQIETWKANREKAEQNLARIQRGIKAREKKLKYHAQQRDKKAAEEA